ncbi:asparagine synthase (glutamine-hydrolyzing) [Natronoarchaeum mannanilyticum]|uniref:Putative asparagine synthetase [glutamine-hydrolyzing] n=1 Tax=Natronoarchaeum mannanilyticum TaxID=926360 RepID=A0AAV3T8E2_9EURY
MQSHPASASSDDYYFGYERLIGTLVLGILSTLVVFIILEQDMVKHSLATPIKDGRIRTIMCGIGGVLSWSAPPNKKELQDINDCQRHRGPDSEGYFLENQIGLAHRRLSIVGVESGDQPVKNEDESIIVVFNGEIYNYLSLREELEEKGHNFTTDTDTEVLVHLYEEYGAELVNYIDGMFAFALWDRNKKELTLARDSIGIKPLFVADDGNRIGFASELPPLLRSNVDQGELDSVALSEYFALGNIPAPKTAFENIQKVLPGERITISKQGINRSQFHNPSIRPVDAPFSEASATLRDIVMNSVQERLMSDVDLGAFLSGGIDSTIITGAISELQDNPIKTFTIGFESDQFDESDAAQVVAQYHETDHTEYTVSADDVRNVVPSVLDRLGEPFADPSLIPTYIVARETSQDVKVALSGDGADELFAGYNRYRGEYYSKFYRALPREIRSMLVEPAINRLPATRSTAIGEAFRKGQKFVNVSADEVPDRHFEWVRKSPNDATSVYRDCDPTKDGIAVMRREHEMAENQLPAERHDSLSRVMAVDINHGLPNQMLQKVDLASMYNSLEVRVPFLDIDIVNYALGLPTEYKITRNDRKRILKDAFDDMIPPKIKSRPKQGFEMPIGEWFKQDLKEDFKSVVRDVDSSLLNADAILKLHEQHISGRQDYEWFLWNIYVFAHWHRRMKSEGHLTTE